MKFFACVLDTAGRGIGDDVRQHMQSMAISRLLTYRWDTCAGAAILTGWDEFGGEVTIERYRDWVGVGHARLDNRADTARHVRSDGASSDDESDLALVVRVLAHHGPAAIPALLGDFGFVAWCAASRTAIAATDAFNGARLYYTQHRGLTMIGSRAEPLGMTNTYDVAYIGDMLTRDIYSRERTIYAGVKQLAAASTLTLRDGRLSTDRYWSVADAQRAPAAKLSEADAIAQCRDLLTTSIRLRLDPQGRTWSQLSGGIDSSSVVSLVQWLAEQGDIPHGLAGTVTFVIGSDTGSDERPFSDQVVKRWRVRNEQVVDAPWWFDETDDELLPLPDQPLLTIIHAPIDSRFRAVLRAAGARVMLTGWGSDQLFTGSPVYLADRLARGQVSYVLGELAHRAAVERGSFWTMGYRHVVRPFLPASFRRFARRRVSSPPNWLRMDTLRHAGVIAKPDSLAEGRIGKKYGHWLATEIADVQRAEETRALAEVVSVRHPFLYRPLVEFALHLPPELCARPHAHKWVLRQAVKGIVPEAIRTRVGKGGGGDSLARMFANLQPFLRQLAHRPILADLGVVDARRLMVAVEEVSNPKTWKGSHAGDLVKALTIEAWLQVRADRWPHGFSMPRRAAAVQQDTYQLAATQRRSV
jgi:asparagine synthase (glutamine-hydrolysing)